MWMVFPLPEELSRVLFYMDAANADLSSVLQLNPAVFTNRKVELGDLISLGQIGIAVVLSIHTGIEIPLYSWWARPAKTANSTTPAVQAGQNTWHSHTYWAAMGIGLPTKGGGTAAEDFRLCGKFCMGFKPGNHFIITGHMCQVPHLPLFFRQIRLVREWREPLPSYCHTRFRRKGSSKGLPTSWAPMGRPFCRHPAGKAESR